MTGGERVRYLAPGELSQCEKNERLIDLQDRILNDDNRSMKRGAFIPELSPNYNPHTGMMEKNDRPVRMINNDSASSKEVDHQGLVVQIRFQPIKIDY